MFSQNMYYLIDWFCLYQAIGQHIKISSISLVKVFSNLSKIKQRSKFLLAIPFNPYLYVVSSWFAYLLHFFSKLMLQQIKLCFYLIGFLPIRCHPFPAISVSFNKLSASDAHAKKSNRELPTKYCLIWSC